MEFPIAIHKDPDTDYGATVADIPGCHSWGKSIEHAIHNAREAIESHVETLLECGDEIHLSPTPVEDLRKQEDYADAVWALVDVDPSKFDAKPERVNISLPRFVLKKNDDFAVKHPESHSGFSVRVALDAIRIAEKSHN